MTYPAAVGRRERSPGFKANQAAEEIGTALASRVPAIAEKRTQMQAQLRKELANTESNGQINHHALALAIRFLPGGRRTFTGFVDRARLNGDPDAKAWWMVYSDLNPAEQARVDFDRVCEAAGVQPDALMGVVVSTAMRMGSDVADLVAATAHPSIVHATVKSAKRIGGAHADVAQKDRLLLLQHQKFAPIPKGTQVHVHASASAQAAAAASSAPTVPTFADSMDSAMSGQRDVQRRLAAREVLDGETVQDDA